MRVVILGLLLALAAYPGVATAKTAPKDKTDDELFAIMTTLPQFVTAEICTSTLPDVQEYIDRHPDDKKAFASLQMWQGYCYFGKGDWKDALAKFSHLSDDLGFVDFDIFALRSALRLDDGKESLKRLKRALTFLQSDRLDTYAIRNGMWLAQKQELDEELRIFAYSFVHTARFEQAPPELQETLAWHALRRSADLAQPQIAKTVLPHIRNPESYMRLLSDRTYEAIWPVVEERVGTNFTTITHDNLVWQKSRFDAVPTDKERFREYIHALYYDGQFGKIVDLVSARRREVGSFDDLQEDDAWSINVEVFSLDALGRPAEADALFDQLAAVSDDKHWLVNFVINRAIRLVGQGRWEEGLEATVRARAIAEKGGTTYAKVLIAGDRVCSLARLGRAAEAESDMAYLLENASEVADVTIAAQLCMGDEAGALKTLKSHLENEEKRNDLRDVMQAIEFEFFDLPPVLPDVRDLIARNPDVWQAHSRHARLIPEQFYPAASIKRYKVITP